MTNVLRQRESSTCWNAALCNAATGLRILTNLLKTGLKRISELAIAMVALDVHRRLLRARELCLLGDYAAGLPEFHRALQDVARAAQSAASPALQQVL